MEKEACDHNVGIDFVGLPLQIYKELPGDLARLRSYWRIKGGACAEDRKKEEKTNERVHVSAFFAARSPHQRETWYYRVLPVEVRRDRFYCENTIFRHWM